MKVGSSGFTLEGQDESAGVGWLIRASDTNPPPLCTTRRHTLLAATITECAHVALFTAESRLQGRAP